ncbi:hypothetical protein EN739_12025 [Mesorhizobium sp. M2A.F.Ca.ET.017.03.2.1]|uniref:hypothetical protein n=1 Tax=unclassified Mesorhizobium TaxID=325217 RepID=UPI000FCAAFF9|nr:MULTISPECIES: hypothetical protein [unclassified Mesorhizobium]RUW38973.1 hypothetical protein EOA37_22065 [Mesorhizobium sp. M2A.F.Ca.ET.015.02.1.1]RVC95682.1 hypothetical protein EN739_12025 [Mesorhizobium sp. M2A.F.Ca.ET.017.03.2.1]
MGKVIALALAIVLAGCAAPSGSFCAVSSPVRLSAAAVDQLTDAQARELLAHNRKGQKLCGWRP